MMISRRLFSIALAALFTVPLLEVAPAAASDKVIRIGY